MPDPPSSSGQGMPNNPRSAMRRTLSQGNALSRSYRGALGFTTCCAKSRTMSRT